jgi:phosphatidylglycerophosphate synthase
MQEASHNPTPTFTQELIEDLIRDRYSLRAWQSLFSRSWARSLEDIKKSPARTRSFWSWTAVVGAMGAGIILLVFLLQTPDRALTALAWWLPWYACVVFFLLTHLGMVDDSQGIPHQSLLLPNGLSFIRLALAPLILWPCLQLPVYPAVGPVFVVFLAGLSLLDLLDGWIARRQNLCTRMGSMLDPLADLALLTFLAVGLYLAGAIPGELLLLLLVIAFKTLLQISWPAPLAIE